MKDFNKKQKKNYSDIALACPICKEYDMSITTQGIYKNHVAEIFLRCNKCKTEWKSILKETNIMLIYKPKAVK